MLRAASSAHPADLVETLSTGKARCATVPTNRTLAAAMSIEAHLPSERALAPSWLVDPDFSPSPTVTIDTASAPGSWARAIRHTPHLAAQVAADRKVAGR